MIPLVRQIRGEDFVWIGPRAADGSWYPERFLAPVAANEPWLGSALQAVGRALSDLADAGISRERSVLLGFSQGACLALEYASRNPGRYGAVVAFSGALIGSDDELAGIDGGLDGTPVFLGSGDRDPHIPVERVRRTEELLMAAGAQVETRLYRNFRHGVNRDELRVVRSMLAGLRGS
jgi:predicted esterase